MSGDHHINRRAVLWNVQQPGDAYDIRKSMIARLPQHPARFMGDNLQLVCLFQAAQIQRLAQFLDEMTLQMRAIQRIQLDRHSYQVQIKELAEKLQVANQFKSENAKLREFIKGQSEQLQNLQRYRNSSQNLIELQTKYQSVLNQLRISRENYSALQRTNNQSLREIAQWRFKCEKLQKSIYQERQVKQREIKISIQKTTLQLRSFYQSKQYQLKGEINVMKQNLVLKNRQIQLQKSKNTQISKLLAQKQELLGKYARGQIQVQTNKTQQFLRISRKLQQSTYYLQQKQKNILNLKDQVTYLNKKIKTIEDQLKRKQEEIRKKQDQIRQKDQQLNRKNQQLQSRQNTFNNNPQLLFRISEHQKRIILLTSEIERLNQILNVKNNQSIDKQKQIMFYKEKSISYERTVEFLQKQIKEKQTFLKKHEYDSHIFQDKDNKIAALGGEIQRLNIVMREKLNQMSRMENRINQLNQSYNQQFNLLRARQEAIKILQDKCRDYDMKIISLQDANKLNFDEFNRLNLKLAGVQNHNIQLRREIDSRFQISSEMNQLQNQISNLNEEINKRNVENKKLREDNQIMFKEIHQLEEKIRISETNLNEIRMTTNQMLFEKDHQIKDLQFTFSQNEKAHLQKIDLYLNSMPKMTTEIDRLHQLIQRRQIQLKKLQQDLEIQRQKNRLVQRRNSTQSEMRILQYERTISFYESKCKNLQKINSDMSAQKNFIIEKVQSLQVKLRESQTQFDKIMTALKVKDATFNEHQKNASILQTAINQLRQENLRLQSQCLKSRQQLQLNFQMTRKIQYELDLCRRQFSKCQTNNSGFNEENMRLKGMIEQSQLKNSGLMQTIQSLRHKLSVYENEKQYLMQEINDKKMRLQVYEQDLRGLQSKISSHQQSLKHTEQANSVKIEQMRQRLIQEYDIRLKNQASKYHKLQDMYRQVQGAYNKEIGGNQQTIKKVQDLQSKNSELIRYLDEYQQKVFSYEQRFALLSQQIQRLSIQNRQWRGRDERVTRNDAAQGQQIRVLKQQLEGTRIEVGNLRLMLNELQSINEHAIAQRDELFVITHEQQGMVGNLRYEINTLQNELLQYRSSQQMVQNEQTIRLREEYNIVRNEFSVLKQEYNKVCNELQMVSRERQNISQYSINLQKQSKALHILQSQSNQYRQQIVVFREENTVLKQQNTVLKQQIVVLKQQNTTLRQQISSLQQEIRTLQQKLSSQQDLFIQVEQLKTAYINIKLQNQQLNRMLQQMQQQLFQSKQLNQQTNRQQQQQQQQYQQQQQQEYQRVINENTQLKTILQQQRHTLLILQQKLNTLSAQIQHANTNYTLQINTLSNTITMLQQQNTQLKQQLQNTKIQLTQYTVYQQISTELQAKYNNLYQAYQETYNIYNLLKQEHQNTTKNLHLTQNKIQKLNQEFNTLNQIVEKLKQQINILNQQNRQLQANSALNQNTYQQIIQNNQHLKKQLQRLYQLNSDLTNQVSQIRLRLCDQHTLQQKIKQNMILFVIMCAQIQSLRKRLYQTEHQCEQVRRSSISPLKPKK